MKGVSAITRKRVIGIAAAAVSLLTTAGSAPPPQAQVLRVTVTNSLSGQWVLAGRRALASDNPRAVTFLERAVVADPANAEAYALLGRAYQQRALLDEAEKYYGIALAIDPLQPDALNWTGQMAVVSDDPETAARNLQRLERSCPDCRQTRELSSRIQSIQARLSSQPAPSSNVKPDQD